MNYLVSGWLGQNCVVNQQHVPAPMPRTRSCRRAGSAVAAVPAPCPGAAGTCPVPQREHTVSDVVFPLLFLLAALRSLPLLPPLSNAVNPILGSWALPRPSLLCPNNSLGFLNSCLCLGLSLPICIQISWSSHSFFLTLGFNLWFLLLLSSLLVLQLFLWLIHYPMPSGHGYFLICTDGPAASFVPSESLIPCVHMPFSRSSAPNRGSRASNANPCITQAGIQAVRT